MTSLPMQPQQQPGGGGGRAAFTFTPIHTRRDPQQQQRITALALHSDGERVVLGLSSGYVEEHRLVRGGGFGSTGGGGACLRLQAERKAFKSAVTAIAPLPTAARMALLSEDGACALMASESLQVVPLAPSHTRGATAIAADRSHAYPPRLAVAVRGARGASRLLVFDVLPGNATTSLSGQPALLAAQVGAGVCEAFQRIGEQAPCACMQCRQEQHVSFTWHCHQQPALPSP